MSTQSRTRSASRLIPILTLVLLIFGTAACSSGTQEVPGETATSPAVAQATVAPAEESAPAAQPTAAAVAEPSAPASPEIAAGETVTFVIDPAQSQARFYIDEELAGQPKRVEGINDQVSGAVTVDLGNYAGTEFAPITLPADNFITDSDRRNGAINRFILQTGQYPTITFTPTGVQNLPDDIAVGQPFSFQLVGDLTIREITSQEILEMTVTPVSESELRGSGSVTVLRETYQLTIPSVPRVANVSEEVLLEIDFVAMAN